MKGWVGLVGWPIADGLPTLVVTHQLQVKRRTGKVRRPETDVLPLCHATNPCNEYKNKKASVWERRFTPYALGISDLIMYYSQTLLLLESIGQQTNIKLQDMTKNNILHSNKTSS